MQSRIKLTIAVMGHPRRSCRYARSRGFRARAQPKYRSRLCGGITHIQHQRCAVSAGPTVDFSYRAYRRTDGPLHADHWERFRSGTQRSLGSWPSLLVLSRRCSKAESGLSIQSGFLSLVGAANAMMMIPPPIARASSRTAIPRLGTSPLSLFRV